MTVAKQETETKSTWNCDFLIGFTHFIEFEIEATFMFHHFTCFNLMKGDNPNSTAFHKSHIKAVLRISAVVLSSMIGLVLI